MLTPRRSKEKQARLIKGGKCFNFKKRGYITYDCPKKRKIAAISEGVVKDRNSQEKK